MLFQKKNQKHKCSISLDIAEIIGTRSINLLVNKNFFLDIFDTSLASSCIEK